MGPIVATQDSPALLLPILLLVGWIVGCVVVLYFVFC
ncbi:sarcoplasmic/endoplasmic reticulum calcium ATPase regulator DWORF-like [Pygocentrus nattereri]|nr:sarcoplasmic/endoplasmic reticulum calcium ATPase regulator DWORF-like [Pygocentrus nattereri]